MSDPHSENEMPMRDGIALSGPAARARAFDALDALQIDHETVEHPPILTVEEGREMRVGTVGTHTKNLFLIDGAKTLRLVIADGERRVDLKRLAKAVGAKARFSFGKPELLLEVLGVTPGSVSVFALLNDQERRIAEVIVDEALLGAPKVWGHPLDNAASTAVTPDDFVRFIRARGYEPRLVDVADPPAPAAE